MSNDIEYPNNPRNGKALAGIILLVVGAALLLRQFDFFFFPHWLFSFPMVLICIGLYIGAKNNFHKPSSFILIAFGLILLIGNNIPDGSRFIWPAMIISLGLWLILRRNARFEHPNWDKAAYKEKWDWRNHTGQQTADTTGFSPSDTPPPVNPSSSYAYAGDDHIDAVSVFGGVKKTILSKNFRGGEIVNIFGGAELDFTQADINGRVIIDITQIFGGTKIIVPSHWKVVSDIAAVFASVDDKRLKTTAAPNSEKILVLKGVSIFAGIDVRSY